MQHIADYIGFLQNSETMQTKGKSGEGLKLQSYKVDSQVLASKINELNDLRSELVTTLSKHRHHQNSIHDELEQLKAQNQKLRALVSDLEFTNKSQAYLIEQLQKRVENAENKAQHCLQQLQEEQTQKESLKNYYERRIATLTNNTENQRKEYEGKIMEISKVTQYKNQGQPPFQIESQSISSIDSSPKAESNRKIKKLKKQSLQSDSPPRPSLQISDKYMTANVIVQREDDSHISGEDVYLQMIRQLYKQLLKIQIRGRELLKIPQIQAFSRLRNPSKNDLARLCGSYPFHIRQTHKNDLIYEFVSRQAERVGKLLNGRFIIELIIEQIQEIDSPHEAHEQEQVMASSYYTDSEANNNRFLSEKMRRKTAQASFTASAKEKNMSIDSGLQVDSESSSYF